MQFTALQEQPETAKDEVLCAIHREMYCLGCNRHICTARPGASSELWGKILETQRIGRTIRQSPETQQFGRIIQRIRQIQLPKGATQGRQNGQFWSNWGRPGGKFWLILGRRVGLFGPWDGRFSPILAIFRALRRPISVKLGTPTRLIFFDTGGGGGGGCHLGSRFGCTLG